MVDQVLLDTLHFKGREKTKHQKQPNKKSNKPKNPTQTYSWVEK